MSYEPPVTEYDSFVLKLLQPEGSQLALDNGTGNGRFAAYLAGLGCVVVALDLNLALLKAAKKRMQGNNNVHTVLADMTRLPFRQECFQRVICVHNLWYTSRYNEALLEMLRVLCANGVLVADHLNLFDPQTYLHLALSPLTLLRAIFGQEILDIGRTLKVLMRPFHGGRLLVWSVLDYDPLRVVAGGKQLSRRFVMKCVAKSVDGSELQIR
jgi:SAM-dependent methyltransferase